MRDEWGYPPSLIMVEKELSHLPLIDTSAKIPKRRVDIVCYANDEKKGLYPLLLVECKESELSVTKKAIRQLLGYNHFIHAPFVAISYDGGIQVWHQDGALAPTDIFKNFNDLKNFRC